MNPRAFHTKPGKAGLKKVSLPYSIEILSVNPRIGPIFKIEIAIGIVMINY
jgi:hypothetical protein